MSNGFALFLFFLLVIIVVPVAVIYSQILNMTPMFTPLEKLPPLKAIPVPLNIVVFMVVTPEIQEYARHSIEINKQYCQLHGYKFHVFDKNLTPDLPINFSKLQATLDLAEDGETVAEYIVHIDADAIFKEQMYPLEAIIHKYFTGLTAFIAGEDCYDRTICSKPGRMNSGVYIVKNNIIGRNIIEKWLQSARKGGKCHKYVDTFPNCQLVFTHCVQFSELMAFIRIVPYNVLNGRDGLFIQHLMQETNRNRTDFFKTQLLGVEQDRLPVFS